MLNTFYADLHIHIGRDINGRPVKITASKTLTLTNILIEASRRKGIDMIGIIDCQAPAVQKEIILLLEQNKATELQDGGIRFEKVTLIMGAEIEVYDKNCHGPIHVLVFMPTIQNMQLFSKWLSKRMKNISLSSQRYYGTAIELQEEVKRLDGLFIPAHVFTPFKSLYGRGVKKSLIEVFAPDAIDAIELGLSSDTTMADSILELHDYTFLTNSDSHSLAKIGREYQQIKMNAPTFKELSFALHERAGRKIVANYGMNPRLGKYYATVCQACELNVPYGTKKCPTCESKKIISGVSDRIIQLSDTETVYRNRPPYFYQVPLEYLPGLGSKTLTKLLSVFENEMNIIHEATYEQLIEVIPEKMAKMIIDLRHGELAIEAGGGGKYGRILGTDEK